MSDTNGTVTYAGDRFLVYRRVVQNASDQPLALWEVLAAALADTQARLAEVEWERDLALAHDRQPYPTAHAYEQVCKALETTSARCEAMREALEKVKREHLVVDEDCWFSCPASGQCCRDDAGMKCNCGADETNTMIEAALAAQEPAG